MYDYTEHVKNDVINCLTKQAQKEHQSLYEFVKRLHKSSCSSKTLYNLSLHETLRNVDNTLNQTIKDQNCAVNNLNGNWLLIAEAFGRKLWQNSVSKDKVNLEYFQNPVHIDVEIRMMLVCEMFDDIIEELRLSNVSN